LERISAANESRIAGSHQLSHVLHDVADVLLASAKVSPSFKKQSLGLLGSVRCKASQEEQENRKVHWKKPSVKSGSFDRSS
jgi:hypothetical protein